MNNQQDGNKVSYEVIKLKAHHAWYEKRIAGDPSLDFYDGYDIGFNAGLKYQSNIINEPITSEEIDAEIERYIKQFWPRPEHGGAVRLGFKRAVRWMQERQSNKPINFEDDIDTVGNCANCGVEFHIHKEKAKNELIKDEELDKKLHDEISELLFYNIGNIVIAPTVKRCIEAAKQYAASKLNNTIEDKWIDITKDCPDYDEPVLWLREDGNMFVESLDKDGNSFLDDEVLKLFDIPKVKYWQPLPPQPTK